MIIDVKATRPESDHTPENRPYRFGDEPKNSYWPLAFAALLTGIALYLKSMFPGWGEAEARPEEQSSEAGEQPIAVAGAIADPGQPSEADPQHAAKEGRDEADAPTESVLGSGGRLFELQRQASFEPILSPEFQLMDYGHFGPISAGSFSFDGVFMAANDNSAPGVVDPGDSGPGGGPEGPGNNGPDDDKEDDNEPNRAPRVGGPVYLADVAGCSIALIGLTELLRNATDPDGDTLSVRNISVSSGTLSVTQGGWLFDAAGYGPVTVTYLISDDALSVLQTAHFDVVRNSVSGSPGDDLLVGTECGDDIDAGDGLDNIDARGGSDVVVGGAGDDHIVAGGGADTVFAGLGNDIVFGGDGEDWISGGEGDDRLFGEAGDDTLFGDKGNDHLVGGLCNDLLFGGEGNDRLLGEEGSDRLSGGAGDDDLSSGVGDDVVMGDEGADKLAAGAGDDTLSGGSGEDELDAGAGDDTVLGDLDGDADRYHGGYGFDTLSYFAARTAVNVDAKTGSAIGAEIGEDEFCAFEATETGAGDDLILGSAAHETFSGNGGNDTIEGSGGDDILFGGDGCDTLSGGVGEDEISAGAGDDTVFGDIDDDDDIFDGGAGADTIDYSAATASVSFDLASGRVSGVDIGDDTISNFEVFFGGHGDDYVKGNGHGGSFRGGAGDDVFEFESLSGAGQRVAYEILDFMAGDRIKISRYEIFEEVMDSLEDRFEDIYGDGTDADDLPILISHERTGDVRRTLIEADLDNDDFYELAITITGDSQVTVVETV